MKTRNLVNLFKSAAALLGAGPQTICRIDGFDFTVTRKQGEIWTGKAETDTPYYEIKIRPNGDNAEYPAGDEAVYRCVEAQTERTGYGFAGGTMIVPARATIKSFELKESFDDGRHTTGHRMPPHHGVNLHIHFQTAAGEKSSLGMGKWVRQSDRETPAWETAMRSRIEYI